MASERIFLRKSGTSATVLIGKKNKRIAIGINLKHLVNENVTSRGSLDENGVKLFPRAKNEKKKVNSNFVRLLLRCRENVFIFSGWRIELSRVAQQQWWITLQCYSTTR